MHRRDSTRYFLCDAQSSRKRLSSSVSLASPNVKPPRKTYAELPPIRVRREPPTIAEAVAAAQDLADDVEQQVEIACGLIGLSADEVRPHVVAAEKARQERPRSVERFTERVTSAAAPNRAPRTVVVERRTRPVITRPTVVVERRSGRPLEPRR